MAKEFKWPCEMKEWNDDPECVGFPHVRLVGPKKEKKSPKPQRKKDDDKILRCYECSPEIQAGPENPEKLNGRSGSSSLLELF